MVKNAWNGSRTSEMVLEHQKWFLKIWSGSKTSVMVLRHLKWLKKRLEWGTYHQGGIWVYVGNRWVGLWSLCPSVSDTGTPLKTA